MNNSLYPSSSAARCAITVGVSSGVAVTSKLTRHLTHKAKHKSVFSSVWMGAASGMVGISAVYPVDVVKTRLQNSSSGAGTIQLFQSIVRSEGYAAFYKGLVPQLCGTGPDKAISLGTRTLISKFQDDPTCTRSIATAAAGAGMIQSTIMSPFEIVKVRMQLDSSKTMGSIIRSLGGRGLYRGFSACFARDVAFSTTYFTLYELAKQRMNIADGGSLGWALVAGIASGVPAAFCTTPLDVIKTRLQADGPGGRTIANVAREIAETEGLGGFLKGSAPRVLRIAPQFGIVLVTFDYLNSRFG